MQETLSRLSLLAAAFAFGLAGSSALAADYHVILMAGQSNMDGHDPVQTSQITDPVWRNPQTNVLYNNANYTFASSYVTGTITKDANGNATGLTNNHLDSLQPGDPSTVTNPNLIHGGTSFGPEVTMGWKLKADNASKNFLIIKYAISGTNLYGQWAAPSGNIYTNFKKSVTNALNLLTSAGNTYSIDGMVWVQGEADSAAQTNAQNYQQNITTLINDVRTNYGANMPFIISEPAGQGTSADGTPFKSTVVAGQKAVASKQVTFTSVATVDAGKTNPKSIAATQFTVVNNTATSALPNVFYIDQEDLNNMSDTSLHYTTYGQLVIGQRVASVLQTTGVPEPAMLTWCLVSGVVLMKRNRNDESACS